MTQYKELPDLIKEFLATHGVAAFATVSPDNSPSVAFVFYTSDTDISKIYISSRKNSNKIQNIIKNHNSALAIVDVPNLTTLQMKGTAKIINEKEKTIDLLEKFSDVSERENSYSFQPTMKLAGGPLLVVEFNIKWFRYSNYLYHEPKILEGKLTV